jgi:sulfide:quinone oxidoreductase
MKTRVVIAGGGVAALEAALALRELADERVVVELLAPEPHFWYRPVSVAEPFELGKAHRYELAALAAAAGATCMLGTLQGVDAVGHKAKTSLGDIPYDVLLVAVGAVPVPAVPGALTFGGPTDTSRIRALLAEIAVGAVSRVAFAAPWGAVWSLPIYELALMTAAYLDTHQIQGVKLSLVTPEEQPLQLFGPAGSEAIAELLDERSITFVAGAHPAEFEDGALRLVPGNELEADRVVALPRLRGIPLDGLAQTLNGFIPIDAHACVRGVEDVYAAGDITSYPVKQGGIATQLADAAAEAIAQVAGADLQPGPFRPVLRGLLLTGDQPRYLRHELAGVGRADAASLEPLWWPPAKIVGRYLAPFLAELADVENPPDASATQRGIRIDVDLEAVREFEQLAFPRLEEPQGDDAIVGDVMSGDFLVVSPEQVLAEVAQTMRDRGVDSAAVAVCGGLIGILTSWDLLRALAARVEPGRARVREWMTAEPVAVSATTSLEVAVSMMTEYGVRHLPVIDGKSTVGMLGLRDAARAVRAAPTSQLASDRRARHRAAAQWQPRGDERDT